MSNIPSYNGSATPTTETAGTPGSFPGAANANSLSSDLQALAAQMKNMTPAEFFSDYNISSNEQGSYLSGSQLNANAVYLAYYLSLNQSGRQAIQSQMAAAGQIPVSDANGKNNSTALGALKSLIGTTSAQGSNVYTYLAQNSSGTNAIQNQISQGLTTAQENANQPITASVENPTTLAATITSAFDNALGYAPAQDQIQSFIDQMQGQETSYAEGPRTEAKAAIAQAQDEESALNKLGPDGIDTVISAYQAAVSGTKMPGAGTVQGPQLTVSQATAPVMSMPGSIQQTQNKMVPQSGPLSTVNSSNPFGNIVNAVNDVGRVLPGHPALPGGNSGTPTAVTPQTSTRNEKIPSTQLAPTHFNAPSTATFGGLYALSAADWQKAQKEYAPAKKYGTPGAAPQSVQLAAFSTLLSNEYAANGNSWSKAITSIASGSPFGLTEGTHLSRFGASIANEVNNQISALQNQVNNSTITTKVTAPDENAEAMNAAKEADPVGYYAANTASWGQELNQMLSGAPLSYGQNTSDTFSGPVSPQVAGTPEVASAQPSAGNP